MLFNIIYKHFNSFRVIQRQSRVFYDFQYFIITGFYANTLFIKITTLAAYNFCKAHQLL